MNWQDFWAMGGYAFYVWMAYGLTLVILVINIVIPVWQRKRFIQQIRNRQKRSN
ncbi:MAG: heme exporter protein CcmD [Gammaproteobacteria bacterium HGW-Gammaproteobacteria-3]|nr:MAG: heme exporter protein CcmD [Gammaproteobacteria bacterium HGW-Gammaproteobacteria-3]